MCVQSPSPVWELPASFSANKVIGKEDVWENASHTPCNLFILQLLVVACAVLSIFLFVRLRLQSDVYTSQC